MLLLLRRFQRHLVGTVLAELSILFPGVEQLVFPIEWALFLQAIHIVEGPTEAIGAGVRLEPAVVRGRHLLVADVGERSHDGVVVLRRRYVHGAALSPASAESTAFTMLEGYTAFDHQSLFKTIVSAAER
jgi:hypothetical protein